MKFNQEGLAPSQNKSFLLEEPLHAESMPVIELGPPAITPKPQQGYGSLSTFYNKLKSPRTKETDATINTLSSSNEILTHKPQAHFILNTAQTSGTMVGLGALFLVTGGLLLANGDRALRKKIIGGAFMGIGTLLGAVGLYHAGPELKSSMSFKSASASKP